MINEDAWDSYTFKYMSGHFESYIDRSSFKRESCVSNSQREQPDNQQKTGKLCLISVDSTAYVKKTELKGKPSIVNDYLRIKFMMKRFYEEKYP